MAERLFNRGEEIFHQGDHGETFYRIIDGTVGIYVNYSEGEEHKLTELTKGQYVGEMAVIDSYPRSATAVALEDGTKLQVPEEKDFLDPPLEKIVYSDNPNSKYIQIMPKPQANHGVLGLMDKGEKVTILAEAGGFYFFVAEDGRAGWNGTKFFIDP